MDFNDFRWYFKCSKCHFCNFSFSMWKVSFCIDFVIDTSCLCFYNWYYLFQAWVWLVRASWCIFDYFIKFYEYNDQKKLKSNKKKITNENKFSCETCEKTFAKKTTLKDHILREHSSENVKEHPSLLENCLWGSDECDYHN